MVRYARLSVAEREAIKSGILLGKSQNLIAEALKRDKSSISREIRRLGVSKESYSPILSDIDSRKKRSSCTANKKKINRNLATIIEEHLLKKRFSPEQISQLLCKKHPEDPNMQISHESIYQYIYTQTDPWKRKNLIKCLRHRKKQRRRKNKGNEKRGQIPNMTLIHERPDIVNTRKEIGHWEGDLIVGKNHQTALLTLVERLSRVTMIVHLGSDTSSIAVVKACEERFVSLPGILKKSITYDRGKEMSQHELLTTLTGLKVYFADPHAPWQRGTNENTNGLIRDFFPKGTDFDLHSPKEVMAVEILLNMRPRKVLGFETLTECMKKHLDNLFACV